MKKQISLIALITLFTVGCEMKLPLKEMSQAKTAISRAYEVKADTFAKEELDAAKAELLKTHQLVKDEKDEDAKKSALLSLEKANQAINKSLPLLAEESLTMAKESFDKLEPVMASKFSAEQYTIAKDKMAEAESLKESSSFWDSHLKSRESMAAAAIAENGALAQSTVIESKIASINDSAAEIKNNEGEKYASEELKAISTSLGAATTSLNEKNFLKSYENIKIAEGNLEIAKVKSTEFFISQKITSAKGLTTNLKSSKFSKDFNKEIVAIEAAILKSENSLKAQKYADATSEIDMALSEIDKLTIAMQKKEEEYRLALKAKAEREMVKNTQKGEYPKSYTVEYNPKNRDCLWKIASKQYNDASLWPLIFITNRDQIKDPDLIFPGQKFIIPSADKKDLVPQLIKKIRNKEQFGEDLEKEFENYLKSRQAMKEEMKMINPESGAKKAEEKAAPTKERAEKKANTDSSTPDNSPQTEDSSKENSDDTLTNSI